MSGRCRRAVTLADSTVAIALVAVVFLGIGAGLLALGGGGTVRSAQAEASRSMDLLVEAAVVLGVWTDDPALLDQLDPDGAGSRVACNEEPGESQVSVGAGDCDPGQVQRSAVPVVLTVAAAVDGGCWLLRTGNPLAADETLLVVFADQAWLDSPGTAACTAEGAGDMPPDGVDLDGRGASFAAPLLLLDDPE